MTDLLKQTPDSFAAQAIEATKKLNYPQALNVESINNFGWQDGLFYGQPAQAIIALDTATVAGGGPATWALNNQAFLTGLAKEKGVPFLRIARSDEPPSFAVNGLTGKFPKMDINLGANPETIPQRFQQIESVLTPVFKNLAENGMTRVFVLSEGYAGYGPFGVTSAAVAAKIQAVVAYQDNCVPDFDNPSYELDQNGYPKDRFFPPAYSGFKNLAQTVAIGAFSIPVPTGAESARAGFYPGMNYAVTGYNFTPEYIGRIKNFIAGLDTETARNLVGQYIPLPDDPDIPMVSMTRNRIYWQPQSWMTETQYLDVLNGSLTVARSLTLVAERMNQPIALVMAEEAADFLSGQGLDLSRLIIIPRPEIPQDAFLALNNCVAKCVIGASRGNNAQAEIGLVGKTPIVIVGMPDNNYMSVSVMDPGAKQYGLPYFSPEAPVEEVALTLGAILTESRFAANIARREQQVTSQNYQKRNYFDFIKRLTGY